MTNASETERAPESKPQPNAGKSAADPPEPRMACDGLARLSKRFPKQVQKILRIGESDSAGEGRCAIYDILLQDMSKHGWACLADVAEFIENWTPGDGAEASRTVASYFTGGTKGAMTQWGGELLALVADRSCECMGDATEFVKNWQPGSARAATPDLNDIRKRFRRIAGLVEAAYLCEGSFTHGSGDKGAIEEYFTAISGTISVAASECRQLLNDTNSLSCHDDVEGGGA